MNVVTELSAVSCEEPLPHVCNVCYTLDMEIVTRNVRDLPQNDRSALERVIGHQLCETQQVIVNVVNLDLSSDVLPGATSDAGVPEWWNVYDGLNDDEIDRLDEAIRQRANLTRDLADFDHRQRSPFCMVSRTHRC